MTAYICQECDRDVGNASQYKEHVAHCHKEEMMKTYTGELKKDTPCRTMARSHAGKVLGYVYYGFGDTPEQVHIDNEWQLFKPQPKKVWGIPEVGQDYFVFYTSDGEQHVQALNSSTYKTDKSHWLNFEAAEQVAKAMNYINEFRALSDVPVDGVEQAYFSKYGYGIAASENNDIKLMDALFGVVVNADRALELPEWQKRMRIADKIVTWGFHGIVTEVL